MDNRRIGVHVSSFVVGLRLVVANGFLVASLNRHGFFGHVSHVFAA